MTRMVVDWQVEAADGKKYDAIFVATGKHQIIIVYNHTEPQIGHKTER